jgi:hypothetical protein
MHGYNKSRVLIGSSETLVDAKQLQDCAEKLRKRSTIKSLKRQLRFGVKEQFYFEYNPRKDDENCFNQSAPSRKVEVG